MSGIRLGLRNNRNKISKEIIMRKSIFLMAGMLVIMLVFGMSVSGCATSQHGVEISNVSTSNIREIYIRNAGTTNWGSNMARNLQNIDKSRFSEKVDIRVVDINGVVYSKYDVPFDNAAFIETNKTSTYNVYAMGALALGLLVVLLLIP